MNWYKLATRSFYDTLVWLKPKMAAEAQRVYDEWQLDDDGYDFEVGAGGICHIIAEAIGNVISSQDYNSTTVNSSCGENHVWCLSWNSREAYNIDIPYYIYETGGGYNWKKKEGVKFDANMIEIYKADSDTHGALKRGDEFY